MPRFGDCTRQKCRTFSSTELDKVYRRRAGVLCGILPRRGCWDDELSVLRRRWFIRKPWFWQVYSEFSDRSSCWLSLAESPLRYLHHTDFNSNPSAILPSTIQEARYPSIWPQPWQTEKSEYDTISSGTEVNDTKGVHRWYKQEGMWHRLDLSATVCTVGDMSTSSLQCSLCFVSCHPLAGTNAPWSLLSRQVQVQDLVPSDESGVYCVKVALLYPLQVTAQTKWKTQNDEKRHPMSTKRQWDTAILCHLLQLLFWMCLGHWQVDTVTQTQKQTLQESQWHTEAGYGFIQLAWLSWWICECLRARVTATIPSVYSEFFWLALKAHRSLCAHWMSFFCFSPFVDQEDSSQLTSFVVGFLLVFCSQFASLIARSLLITRR